MKRNLCFFIMGLLCLIGYAIPADPTPINVTQPDGTTLTVKLHGDEFFHFTTTLDGYTVMKNAMGFYTYARQDGDRLVSTNRIARNAADRTAADRALLSSIPKGLTSRASAQSGQQMLTKRNGAMRRVGADGRMDYDNFRGLIILINYTDKKFSMNNASEFYNDMVNTHDYTGYTLNGRRVRMTGSVRDYFYDNSAHYFDPVFDVVGPVDVNYSCTFPQSTNRADIVFNAALDAIDDEVDFSDYDSDGDGYVDMVFFLVAGFSANYSGNNENYLWPHMYYLYNTPWHDYVGFGLYACSTEIAGWEGYWSDVNGIGTFCHEFGHVLGLPDLYDTDYSGSGGESRNPGEWSIMAGGSGNNFGRNPVGYSLYERYALGFTRPEVIKATGNYTLQPLDESNKGLRLNTPNQDEFFLIENRQAGKWDQYLPGHGMMVARVDSTNERIWWMNEVNCNPDHMYYDLLRATYNGQDSNGDPFPGSGGVTSINNFTNPSLLTWDKQFNEYIIDNITEENNIISFNVEADSSIIQITETFNSTPVSEVSATGVKGTFCSWDLVKCAVEEYEGYGQGDGSDVQHAIGMKKPSQVTTSAPLLYKPLMVRFAVNNPTKNEAKVRLSYSQDKGQTWYAPAEGTVTVGSLSTKTTSVALPTDAPVMLRWNQTSGSAKLSVYLDDIVLFYKDTWPGEEVEVVGDINGDGEVNISDVNLIIALILGDDIDDDMIHRADLNGDGEINISDVNALIDLILGQ